MQLQYCTSVENMQLLEWVDFVHNKTSFSMITSNNKNMIDSNINNIVDKSTEKGVERASFSLPLRGRFEFYIGHHGSNSFLIKYFDKYNVDLDLIIQFRINGTMNQKLRPAALKLIESVVTKQKSNFILKCDIKKPNSIPAKNGLITFFAQRLYNFICKNVIRFLGSNNA